MKQKSLEWLGLHPTPNSRPTDWEDQVEEVRELMAEDDPRWSNLLPSEKKYGRKRWRCFLTTFKTMRANWDLEMSIKAKADAKSLESKAMSPTLSTPIRSILKKAEEEVKVEEVPEEVPNVAEAI